MKLLIDIMEMKLLNCPDDTVNYNINEVINFKDSFLNEITIFVR